MQNTTAWLFQVWIASGLAVAGSIYGISFLEDTNLKLMGACLFVSIYVSITLQKMIRDNQAGKTDTMAYRFVPWIGLVFAFYFTWTSIRGLENVDTWHRNFLIVSFLFVVSSVFVLTKTLRDQAEFQELNKETPNQD